MPKPLLEIHDLKKEFATSNSIFARHKETVKAVQGVSLKIQKGETLGLVGESGCGKSTLGRCILKLLEPTEGQVLFDGEDITSYSKSQMRPLRQRMQIIFQDPYASLNPRMKVGTLLAEPLIVHNLCSSKAARLKRVGELLDLVGLSPDSTEKYPHEFSGGQRQRIGIARALAVNPEFIVCDEPVSALDVSIQAQIINLLMDLQEKLGLTYLFIAHDLKVVEHISTRVAVMYLGRIVEIAPSQELYLNAKHPYTQALLSAIPIPDPHAQRERVILRGDVPSPVHPPSGCAFHPRCPKAMEKCAHTLPDKRELKNQAHSYNCLL